MLTGRRITIRYPSLLGNKGTDLEFEVRVLSFKRLLPVGPVASGEPSSYDGVRTRDLVQLWTDPGGMRTLALEEIIKIA